MVALAVKSFISDLTRPKRAISMANAINVKVAARNDNADETSINVRCVERPHRKARKVTPVARSEVQQMVDR